jgi:hypothetical protein
MPKTGSVTIAFFPLQSLLRLQGESASICVLFSFDIRFCIVLKFFETLAVLRRDRQAQKRWEGQNERICSRNRSGHDLEPRDRF